MFFTLEEARLRKEAADLELVKEMSHLLSSEHVRGNVHLLTNSVKHSCLVQSTLAIWNMKISKLLNLRSCSLIRNLYSKGRLYVLIMSW